MDAIALHDDAFHLPGLGAYRAHAGIHVHADLPARAVGSAIASPLADVVVLDDDIVRAGQQADRVLLRAFQGEAAHDDVGRRDRDVVQLRVAAIDSDTLAGIEHVPARAAALGNVDLLRAACDAHGASDGKALAPRAGGDASAAARVTNFDLVFRAGLEMHQAAAAFRVARIEPERQALAPRRRAELSVLDRAAARARSGGRGSGKAA